MKKSNKRLKTKNTNRNGEIRLTIEIPLDLKKRAIEAAHKEGLSLSDYVKKLVLEEKKKIDQLD